MTPLGERLRELRRQRGVTLKAMADAVGVSAPYLSALEHGRRGLPTFQLVQRFITYFNIIWDEAEELERRVQISDPRVVVDTSGLSARATEFANRLARTIGTLDDATVLTLQAVLDAAAAPAPR